MKIYSETKIYEGLGYTPENVEEIERRAREEGTAAGATDGYNDGYESGRTDYEAYKAEYFTVEALSAGTLDVYHNTRTTQLGTLFYMVNDDENWVEVPRRSSGQQIIPSVSITLFAGDKVKFKGTLDRSNKLFNNNSLPMNAYGNIQSLYYDDAFSGETTCRGASNMFKDCTGLVDAFNLVLPATTLAEWCYEEMFYGCTSLTGAPVLPATTLAICCYESMFQGCTSLTTTPELPATTLAKECYAGMFSNCTGLTFGPDLPATALASVCYRSMFAGCTSLVQAPALPATTLSDWCYRAMFVGCTSLKQAPVLPATTLADYCYEIMFQTCSSLNYVKCLATDISATNCTNEWVKMVASTGTFVKNPAMSSWTTGNNGIPRNWTVVDADE